MVSTRRRPKTIAPAPAPTIDESESSSEETILAVPRGRPKKSLSAATASLRLFTEPKPSRTDSRAKRKPSESTSTRSTKRPRGQSSEIHVAKTRKFPDVGRQDEEADGVDGDGEEDGGNDDNDVPLDPSVLNALNSFTKPMNTTAGTAYNLVVNLRSSRSGRHNKEQGDNLSTIEEFPQSRVQERPVTEYPPLEDLEEEEVYQEADQERQGDEDGEGEDDDIEEDDGIELFADPTPTRASLRSPELDFIRLQLPPPPPPARGRDPVYDMPSDEESTNFSVPVTALGLAARKTVNGLAEKLQSKAAVSFLNQGPLQPQPRAPSTTASSVAPSHGRHTHSRTADPNASDAVSRTVPSVARETYSLATRVAPFSESASEDSEDEQPEENEQDEVQEDHPDIPEHDDSLFIHPPSNIASEPTVNVSSTYITQIRNLMGRPGWTGLGKTWEDTFSHNPAGVDGTPARTKIGGTIFKYLHRLKEEFYKAPKAPQLAHQNQWLLEQDDLLKKYITEIGKIITKIREDRLAVIGNSDRPSNDDLKLRRALVVDLLGYIIPTLAQVLWGAFSLGGGDDEDESDTADPPADGVFVASTLQYLVQATGWVRSLDTVLRFELEVRPLDDSRPSPSAPTQNKKKLARPETINRNRGLLSQIITLWDQELKDAAVELDDIANNNIDAEARKEQRERAQRTVIEQRARIEEEELASSQRRWEESCLSMTLLRQKPRPLEARWLRATAPAYYMPPTSSSTSAPSMRGALSLKVQREPWREEKSLMEHELLSSDDKQYLLNEIRRTDREYITRFDLEALAETLERTIPGVKLEIEALKQAARDLSMKKRLEPEFWSIRKESW
ncbi:hypothetical protein B0H67DRAFT_648217 [Lasiosphaeris hirsuta]|uniref:Uncharacterized protein n=1 Tax=Lasiosphaeris hirsuta TaxID=260670 RepID=A0AA40A2L0_9PEZI|nr:hypothetical protein B0H67DRAFT_648217 [Lasiosphaeris hirsuta]